MAKEISSPYQLHQPAKSQQVFGPSQVIAKGKQGKFTAYFPFFPEIEVCCSKPSFYRSKGMP